MLNTQRILIGIACIYALMSLAFQIWVLIELILLGKEISNISQQILNINQLEANRTSSTPISTTQYSSPSKTSPNIPTTQTTDFDPQNSFLGNLNGHGDEVNLMVPLSNTLLATASYDDKIVIWNTTSRTQKYNFGLLNGGHKDAVSCLISLDNNRRLASGSFDFNIKIWDTVDIPYYGHHHILDT